MKEKKIKKEKLQSNIPEHIVNEIWRQAENKEHYSSVYRVSKWGEIEEKVFWNTYREIQEGILSDDEKKYPKNEIGTYSLSVYDKPDSCIKYIKMLKKKVRLRELYPHPQIIQGKTSRGLVQRTIERKEGTDPTHIDWWIFEGSQEAVMKEFVVSE